MVTISQTTEHGISQAMEEESMVEDNGIYNFTLHIGEISGLKPVYPVSEVELTVSFNNDIIYQSDKLPMTEMIAIEQDITLTLNIDDFDMINQFVTTPIVFSLTENDTTIPSEPIRETRQVGKVLWRSEQSVLDLEEALFGKKSSIVYSKTTTEQKLEKKSLRKSKSKGSRSSQGSIQKGKRKQSSITMKDLAPLKPVGPQEAGTASVDLIRLFLGDTELVESLILKAPAGQPLDDRMKSTSNLPSVQITINVDKPLPSGNLFYFTLESIYNLPKIMSKNMTYEMIINIPAAVNTRQVYFDTYTYAEQPRESFMFKKYYGTNSESNFVLRDDFDNIKTKLSVKLSEALKVDFPRLEYNIIKGEYATVDDINALKSSIIKYRCIGVELYMASSSTTKKRMSTAITDLSVRKNEGKSKKGSKKSSMVGKEPATVKIEEEYLHLMAFIDVCRLLCPGEQKTRVACELRTFDMDEFEQTCGVRDSYFRPKSTELPQANRSSMKKSKEKKDVKKGDVSSIASRDKSKDSINGKNKPKSSGNLKTKLPAPPSAPEPSRPVYNENGDPTFIIMEFELRVPIVKALDIQDLHDELEEIIEKYSKPADEPRVFKSKYISKDIFQNSLRSVAQNLKQQYLEYVSNGRTKENVHEFLDYLASTDQYKIHVNSLTKSAATYCNVALHYDPSWTEDEYHAFISQSYITMVELLNSSLTQMNLAGDESVTKAKNQDQPDSTDELLFYAKESTDLGALSLATRYYLQRIAGNDTCVEYWLDYAIYKLQIEEPEAAQECVMEALAHNKSHKDCLLFFSCLIARKGQVREAETCLLNITICNPKWILGWMALYCIYQRSRNYDGMELCLEMAKKHESVPSPTKFDDLAWTSQHLPDKYTYRTITYFIHMRLFEEAEVIIANEVIRRETDFTEYLLAVINMYKGHYEHALEHIERAFELGSCSYYKNALRAHIYSHLDKPDCAIFEYENILKTNEEIPYDSSTYLVYLKAGMCYSAIGTHQTARKVLLKASEKRGTPYSWLTVGVLYYYQNDYLSAEECLTISNSLDNLMPETWAYLALVNIKLGRPHEATNCYHQALDRRLQNADLLTLIDDELKKWEDEFLKTS